MGRIRMRARSRLSASQSAHFQPQSPASPNFTRVPHYILLLSLSLFLCLQSLCMYIAISLNLSGCFVVLLHSLQQQNKAFESNNHNTVVTKRKKAFFCVCLFCFSRKKRWTMRIWNSMSKSFVSEWVYYTGEITKRATEYVYFVSAQANEKYEFVNRFPFWIRVHEETERHHFSE